MNHSLQSQCLGKFKYPTFDLAQMVAGRKRDAKMTPYHCPHCHYYHIGNTPQKIGKYVKGKKDVLSKETKKPDGSTQDADWPQGRGDSR